ncbi:hypothetical protein SLEP1_g57242 [Rubroshorea leprosula]|uniref:Uncharacterized protein n=1 Tax=Rubroshorea leprosula TaxID=152421 RepID=A0AAV5ML42_9ROSI|nr:hypothetical protein SLEP1_g57242 [Rubroshorea leprosula]
MVVAIIGWPESTHGAHVFTNTLEKHKDVFPSSS